MPSLELETEKIYYGFSESSGTDHLILIHGSGQDHSTWPPQLRSLSGINVIALDLPGHGRSTGSGRHSVADYACVIEGVVTKLGLSSVSVAGHSLGGAIALTLALDQPGWLKRLILVGTGARLRVAPEILSNITENFEVVVQNMGPFAFGSKVPAKLEEQVMESMRQTGPEVTYGDFFACDRFDVMARLGEIRCDTLVVTATEDKLTPLKYGEFLKNNISGARMVSIADAGHMMALEKPDDVTDAIAMFLGTAN